jgi:hypothetical protein
LLIVYNAYRASLPGGLFYYIKKTTPSGAVEISI